MDRSRASRRERPWDSIHFHLNHTAGSKAPTAAGGTAQAENGDRTLDRIGCVDAGTTRAMTALPRYRTMTLLAAWCGLPRAARALDHRQDRLRSARPRLRRHPVATRSIDEP